MEIKKIILTEKSKFLQEKQNTFSFLCLPNINKNQIRREILEIFPELKIKKIRTCIYKPTKQKLRYTRKLPGSHQTKKEKKAFVELAPDSVIPFQEKEKPKKR